MSQRTASVEWLEVSVRTSREAAEAVAAQLLDLAPGYAEEPDGDGVRLVAWLPADSVAHRCAEALEHRVQALRSFGLDPGPAEVQVRRVSSRRWDRAWKGNFRPFRVGRFVIRPPWSPWRRRGRELVLVINPGMAFGTGLHESTRLCLRALPALVRPGCRVFDVGTGSGILAIAAAKLGAEVVAVDCDDLACRVAEANARRNRVSRRVQVRCGDLFEPLKGRADVVLTNISAEVLLRALPRAAAYLEPGGAWVVSGMVAGNAPAVLEAARGWGFRVERELEEGEWRAAVLRPNAREAPAG